MTEQEMINKFLSTNEVTECDTYSIEEINYKRDKLKVNMCGKVLGRTDTNKQKIYGTIAASKRAKAQLKYTLEHERCN